MEETSALHTALGLLPPAVVIDSLRYVSARPLPKTTPQDHIRRLVRTRQLFRIAQNLNVNISLFINADQGKQGNRS
jgi:hypothetical protein